MNGNLAVRNAAWIIFCKGLQSLIQLAVGMLCARYLGPSNYGLLHYAASVTAFAIPLMQLGLQVTMVQEYLNRPGREEEVLGTGLALNFLSAILCAVGVTAFALAANRNEKETVLVCALYSTSLLTQSLEMIQYLFHAKLQSKYPSLAMLLAYGLVCGYKIWLLAAGKSVGWFALTHTVEYGVSGVLMAAWCRRVGCRRLRFSGCAAREMLQKSRFYIPAALLTVIINCVGAILLKLLSGTRENGYYAAAVTCSVVIQFVYAAILESARPVILRSRSRDRAKYEKELKMLCCGFFYGALVQSVVFTALAGPILKLLYGQAYLPAVPVLRILIWQTAFALLGWVRDLWLLAEEKHDRLWPINLWTAALCSGLNLLLIPCWGACGAAAAAVVTQMAGNVLIGFAWKETRPGSKLLLEGTNPKWIGVLWTLIQNKLAAQRAGRE